MIAAYATLKKAAANANHAGGRLDDERHRLIVQTSDEGSFATNLGTRHAYQVSLLEETLEEEKETDEKLTELTEKIDTQANESGNEQQDEARSRDKTLKSRRVA